MNTAQHQPDPARVMIVVEVAKCSLDCANRTIQELDKHDTQQQASNDKCNSENGGGYASLPDLLPIGKSALIMAGYPQQEAENILLSLFTGLAAEPLFTQTRKPEKKF
jgi:hypothetical protein